MDFLTDIAVLEKVSVVGVLALIAVLVITDRLVWHTRLKEIVNQRDRWEKVALTALTANAQAGVKAAEVAVDVVSALPDPAASPEGNR